MRRAVSGDAEKPGFQHRLDRFDQTEMLILCTVAKSEISEGLLKLRGIANI